MLPALQPAIECGAGDRLNRRVADPEADETARYFHFEHPRRSSSALNFCCDSGSWPFAAHQASYANRISAVASDAPGATDGLCGVSNYRFDDLLFNS